MIPLGDAELTIVMNCARALPPSDRDQFLREVASELGKFEERSDLAFVIASAPDCSATIFSPVGRPSTAPRAALVSYFPSQHHRASS